MSGLCYRDRQNSLWNVSKLFRKNSTQKLSHDEHINVILKMKRKYKLRKLIGSYKPLTNPIEFIRGPWEARGTVGSTHRTDFPDLTVLYFSIETRLDKLKLNLKKGILGMDKVLQGIQMESPIKNSKGDYCKENFDTKAQKKSPLVEVKN